MTNVETDIDKRRKRSEKSSVSDLENSIHKQTIEKIRKRRQILHVKVRINQINQIWKRAKKN